MSQSNIKERMKAVGYTQRQAALDLGITEMTVQNKLSGRTKFTRAELMLIEKLLSEKEVNVKS